MPIKAIGTCYRIAAFCFTNGIKGAGNTSNNINLVAFNFIMQLKLTSIAIESSGIGWLDLEKIIELTLSSRFSILVVQQQRVLILFQDVARNSRMAEKRQG